MRRVVLIGWLAVSGCFYAPPVADCSVACTDTCPAGLSCIEGLCRKNAQVACACHTGVAEPCGITRGACRAGTRTCVAGAWSTCVGELAASPEICDGVDNDCDGFVDQSAPVVIFEGPTRDWRFLSLDAGYALLTTVVTDPDGGDELTTVYRLGSEFEPLKSTAVYAGPRAITEAAAINSTVYLAFSYDGGLELSALEDGQLRTLQGVEDAGVHKKVKLAVNGERLVAHWDRPGLISTRLARWSLDGKLTDVTDFAELDAGYQITDGYSPGLSSRGNYAVYTTTAPTDAGFSETNLRVLVDTRTLTLLRLQAPYYQYEPNDSHLVEMPSGALSSVYSYVYTPDSWSGIYSNPDMLQLDTADELTVEEVKSNALAWGNSDAVVDAQGRLSFVYMDNISRRLILARSVGLGRLAQLPVKQPQASSDGFGVPRLGEMTAAGFLPLAWNDQTRITARRVCPVR